MNHAEYILPGAIQVTHTGPLVECDDEAWLRKLYRDIGLNEDGAKREAATDGNAESVH